METFPVEAQDLAEVEKPLRTKNYNEEADAKNDDPASSWAIDPNKGSSEFRNYEHNPREEMVRDFYYQQHTNQTYQFVMGKRQEHLRFNKCVMTIMDMAKYLADIVDESDPDTDLSQLMHAIQTAEAIRQAYPGDEFDWLHVTGFIHDLGKVLAVDDPKLQMPGDPQWCVVGDIFPVGCAFSDKNVFPDYFADNPDASNPEYNTKFGVYSEHCGLSNVVMSWGHDDYMYNIAKQQSRLPEEALYMLRYHSFYPWHKKGAYMYLCDETDLKMLPWVQRFQSFDLYSKSQNCPTFEEVVDYYKEKIDKFFPNPVQW